MSKVSEYIRNAGKNSFHHTDVFELLKERDELLAALEAVCKEFGVLKFPLNEYDMSQAAFVSNRARAILAKVKGE